MAVPHKRKGSQNYWADIWFGGRKRSISLQTSNYGIARAILHDKLASLRQVGLELPTRTAIGPLVGGFIQNLQASGRPKSVQTDVYRLREFFGPVCTEVMSNPITRKGRGLRDGGCRKESRKGEKAKQYEFAVKAHFVEAITTPMVSDFLVAIRNRRRLDPKTVNEYREILHRFFAWSIEAQSIRFPGESKRNPVASVKRLRVPDPTIRILRTLEDIRSQLQILEDWPQLQAMVAVLIYAGLRRSELLHLTVDDVADYLHRQSIGGFLQDGLIRRRVRHPEWSSHLQNRPAIGLTPPPSRAASE